MINLLFYSPILAFVFFVAVIISLTVHEFAHGFVAYLYGDDTAKRLGRLTFNPLAHLDIFGTLFFILIGFGWGKPVPINPLNFKKRKEGEIVVALAGPFSNLILAVFFAIIFKIFAPNFLDSQNLLYIFLLSSFQLNITLMIFNLIPIPPLDGSHILNNLLSDKYYKFKAYLLLYGNQILFLSIIFSQIAGIRIFGWITDITKFFGSFLGLPMV